MNLINTLLFVIKSRSVWYVQPAGDLPIFMRECKHLESGSGQHEHERFIVK